MRRIVSLVSALFLLSAVGCSAEAQNDVPVSSDDTTPVAGNLASNSSTPDYRRTVVYIYGETRPGQDMFIRGGLDHTVAKSKLGYDCAATPSLCSIPIRYRNTKNATTAGWKQGDTLLDWGGAEAKQGRGLDGSVAQGSALDWTTNYWPSDWGAEKTYDKNGYGVDAMNQIGPHEWKLDVDMDCSKAFADANGNRWFEIKSYISNGPGWEADVHQAGSPYQSINHFAQCGKINTFARGYDLAQIYPFNMPKSISCAGGTLTLKPSSAPSGGGMSPWDLVMSDQNAIDYFVAQSQSTFDFYEPTYNCGAPFHATITKHFPGTVQVTGTGSSRKLTANSLYTYTNGAAFASGQYGVQVDPSGDGVKVSINGVEMPCSHSAASYLVGDWTFAHCTYSF